MSKKLGEAHLPVPVKRPGVGVDYEKTHVGKMRRLAEASKKSTRRVGPSPRP